MNTSSFRRRTGFSMVEVLVSLAIIAIMTATIVPGIVGKMRDARRSALSQTLLAISQGAAEYRKAVTRYPPTLTVLTVAPVAGVTTDACGGSNYLSVGNANNWRGPYLSREMLANGLRMADGVIQNPLRRVASGTAAYLLIDVSGVETIVATDLEDEFDGSPVNAAAGTIRYTTLALPAPSTVGAANPGTVNLSYSIPIAGC